MNIFFITIFLFIASSFAQGEQNEAEKRKELLGNVRVSKVNSMDNVKGSYKSPKKAMFMSLVLPGSGQIYVGNKQSRYIRGAFYLAEEIALITGLYYHSFYKYDKQVKKYQDFAKKNFSVSRYEEAMRDLYSADYPDNNFSNLYGGERENYCKSFYGTKAQSYSPCVDNFGIKNNPDDNTPIVDKDEFYRTIANENFVIGWEGFEPGEGGLDAISANLYKDDPAYIKLGTSKNYDEYLSLRKKANSSADKQAIFLGALILNHIVSAVDAALSARAHNNSLYEEKVSFTDNLRLGSDISMGENFKAGASLRYAW